MDDKLDKLVKEVHRLEVIFDECDPAASYPAILELRAAEERLDLYFKEKKNLQLASKIGSKKILLI